jgi:hypothetical protein
VMNQEAHMQRVRLTVGEYSCFTAIDHLEKWRHSSAQQTNRRLSAGS